VLKLACDEKRALEVSGAASLPLLISAIDSQQHPADIAVGETPMAKRNMRAKGTTESRDQSQVRERDLVGKWPKCNRERAQPYMTSRDARKAR